MYKKITCYLVLAMAMLWPDYSFAQSADGIIDIRRIRQKSVRKLVRKENVSSLTDFQQIATACYQEGDSVRYETNLISYEVKAGIEKVWETYAGMSPKKAWSGRTVNFGFLFSKPKNEFIYAENADDPIGVGNIIYVNLRLLKGLKNLGVGFEITRLDEVGKMICFCYLKDGVSNGSQEIRFTKMTNGDTQISHLTHYRSRSAFRDKELYPRFHEKFVGEFHKNILRQIEEGL